MSTTTVLQRIIDAARAFQPAGGVDQADDRAGNAVDDRSGDQCLRRQLEQFDPAFRHQRADAAQRDAQAAEVGEAAKRIRQDHAAVRREIGRRNRSELDVRDQFVQHQFRTEQRARLSGLRPRNADQPGDRREHPTHDSLQRQCFSADRRTRR